MEIINRFSEWIAKKLIENNAIEEDEISVYSYGINMLLNTAISYICCIFFGVVYSVLFSAIACLTGYLFIRTYTGGFHFENAKVCFFVSLIEIWGSVFSLSLISHTDLVPAILVIGLLSMIIIFIIAPVDTSNKRLDALEVQVYGKRAKISVVICMGISLIGLFLKSFHLFSAMQIAIIASAITALIGVLSNKSTTLE